MRNAFLFTLTYAVASIVVVPVQVSAGLISVDDQNTVALPDSMASVLFLIQEDATPLFGYSLDINIVPLAGSVGTVDVDLLSTNFFDARNLITAGGRVRDPTFSDIIDTGDGGVFITTNTDDNSTVLPIVGVNDVLAEVVFSVSPDALGDFSIELGEGSALSDGNAFPIDFTFTPGIISVIPEPSSLSMLLFLGVYLLGRRRGQPSRRATTLDSTQRP